MAVLNGSILRRFFGGITGLPYVVFTSLSLMLRAWSVPGWSCHIGLAQFRAQLMRDSIDAEHCSARVIISQLNLFSCNKGQNRCVPYIPQKTR